MLDSTDPRAARSLDSENGRDETVERMLRTCADEEGSGDLCEVVGPEVSSAVSSPSNIPSEAGVRQALDSEANRPFEDPRGGCIARGMRVQWGGHRDAMEDM